jgi:Putative adhesin
MTFISETGSSGYPPGSSRASVPLRMTPARWVVLALALPVALALIGWTGFSLVGLVAKGSYPFSYAVPVHNGQVNVTLNGGNVTLRQVSGSAAQVTGIVQYGLFRPGISESAAPGGVYVGVNCDAINSNCGANATLDVPARTAVTVSSDGGDIGVSGFSSGMTLSTEGGNLTASNLAGYLNLDTSGGDLTGTGLTGTINITTEGGNVGASNVVGTSTVRMDTGGGDLSTNGITGNLQFSTDGGNVNADAVTSQQVTITSGGGDVTLAFSQVPSNLRITAQGGNVTVILPSGDTKYDISTPDTQGGNVNFPSTLASSTSPDKISVDSGGGDITITQAS